MRRPYSLDIHNITLPSAEICVICGYSSAPQSSAIRHPPQKRPYLRSGSFGRLCMKRTALHQSRVQAYQPISSLTLLPFPLKFQVSPFPLQISGFKFQPSLSSLLSPLSSLLSSPSGFSLQPSAFSLLSPLFSLPLQVSGFSLQPSLFTLLSSPFSLPLHLLP